MIVSQAFQIDGHVFGPWCDRFFMVYIKFVFLILLDALDTLDERLTSFFKKCIQPNVKSEWKEEQFDKIKQVR